MKFLKVLNDKRKLIFTFYLFIYEFKNYLKENKTKKIEKCLKNLKLFSKINYKLTSV